MPKSKSEFEPRPTFVDVEVTYTAKFTKTIRVDCQHDGSVQDLIDDAVTDIEPGTGEYVDDSWEVNEQRVVDKHYD